MSKVDLKSNEIVKKINYFIRKKVAPEDIF